MSRTPPLGLLAALSLMMPGSAATQQTEAGLQARLDSLRPLVEAAQEDLLRVRERGRQRAVEAMTTAADLDTLRIGLMTVVTPVEQAETAREIFTEVWEEHYSGIVESPGLERATFSFQWSNEEVPIHLEGYGQQHIRFARFVRRGRVADQVRHAIGVSITHDLSARDTRVSTWVRGEPHRSHDLKAIYRQLASTESKATRECFEGDIHACKLSLGLDVDDAVPLDAWYAQDERRALVASNPGLGSHREFRDTWEACVLEGAIEACDSILSRLNYGEWTPLTGEAAASLLWFALDRGGRGAWGRLVADPEMSPEAALENASGMELDALVAEWRTWVMDNRPDVYQSMLPKSGMALVWTLVFAAFAMRSTRWRLG